ncbi:MAG: MltA domain-containing protein [Rickettsiales bacterium]|jgi:membrane-bound lytic murein transglycosylase A|nr:MltA domain-containing protein [Rickettsiales bacterium]
MKHSKSLLFAICSLLFLYGCGDLTDSGTKTDYRGDVGNARIPANLTPVSYSQLNGWNDDDVRYALRAFRNTCRATLQYDGKSVSPDRAKVAQKCAGMPAENAGNNEVRDWFERHFQPYKIKDEGGKDTGTFTGYYSPMIPACRAKTAHCSEPLMGVPNDGRVFEGVPKKTILEKQIGRVLYWAHPVDVQNIQIQGSGMLKLEDGELIKLNFAAVNNMPFRSIGGQLQERGIRPDGGYSADAVWTYLKQHTALAREVINNNPRYVYFYVSVPPDVVGKLGTPLSKIRSIAVDDSIYTIGMPVWVETNLSDGRQFKKLMIAQDTGGAIKGWVRADIFFGTGDEAYQVAHGQHAQGKMYIFIPK